MPNFSHHINHSDDKNFKDLMTDIITTARKDEIGYDESEIDDGEWFTYGDFKHIILSSILISLADVLSEEVYDKNEPKINRFDRNKAYKYPIYCKKFAKHLSHDALEQITNEFTTLVKQYSPITPKNVASFCQDFNNYYVDEEDVRINDDGTISIRDIG